MKKLQNRFFESLCTLFYPSFGKNDFTIRLNIAMPILSVNEQEPIYSASQYCTHKYQFDLVQVRDEQLIKRVKTFMQEWKIRRYQFTITYQFFNLR